MIRAILGAGLVVFATGAAVGQSAATAPAFDVASVKPDKVGTNEGPGRGREEVNHTPDSLNMQNVRLSSCIKWAYGVNDYQISGPDWLNSERYDVIAKSAAPVPDAQLRLMLQALLADRFKLAFHRQSKEIPVYALVLGKNGPKLHPSESDGESTTKGNKLSIEVKNTSMAQLADLLTNPLGRPVMDETGLKGRYDFTVDLAPYMAGDCISSPCASQSVGAQMAEHGPDMADVATRALRDQIGLSLESRKSQVEILVIDHAERIPTEN